MTAAEVKPGDVLRYVVDVYRIGRVNCGDVTVLKVTAKKALVRTKSGEEKRVSLTNLEEADQQFWR